jgi:hypothetical protein
MRINSLSHSSAPLVGFLGVLILLALIPGCGRKLPPLPPALPEPIEVISIKFEGNEVVAKASCNVARATVTLLGKPKGICPQCTDDLEVIQKVTVENPGEVTLRDAAPRSNFMVYRVAAQRDTSKWITPAQIVVHN